MCLHHQAFYEMFQNALRTLEHPNENGGNDDDEKCLCNLIRFYITIET